MSGLAKQEEALLLICFKLFVVVDWLISLHRFKLFEMSLCWLLNSHREGDFRAFAEAIRLERNLATTFLDDLLCDG